MPRKVEIDVDALNKAVADGVAKNARTMKTAHDDAAVEAGAAKSASVIEDVEKTFCGAWPKVNSFLDKILDNFGWLAPKQAALARSVVSAINKVVVPAICGTGVASPSA
jgi:prophage DNA circulation protein